MNASHELGLRLKGELEDLNSEIQAVSPLFEKVRSVEPDAIEFRAIGATLNAFYNGAERIFLLIAKTVDQKVPASPHWHRELLEQMLLSNDLRVAIIDDELYYKLIDYLGFRHFFRHSYPMELNWRNMEPLTRDLQSTHKRFVQSIESYVAEGGANN